MLSNEEIQERKNFLGASDMPIILGLSKYKTPLALFYEKTGMIEIDLKEGPAQLRGRLLEPGMRMDFEARKGFLVPELNKQVHPKHPFIRCNLDGYNKEKKIVYEAKSSSFFMKDTWGEDKSDSMPLEYIAQIATSSATMNELNGPGHVGELEVFIEGIGIKSYQYAGDSELESLILDAGKNFWECVQNKKEPDPIDLNDYKLKYKKSSPEKKITVNDEILMEYALYCGLLKEIKHLEEIKVKSQMLIMEYMKDCEVLTDASGAPLITWKANVKGTRVFLTKGI